MKYIVGAQPGPIGCGFRPSPLAFSTLFRSCTVVAPQSLQLLKSTDDSLLVGWRPSAEVDHYLLSYHPLGKELSGRQVQVPKEQHSYDILGLLPGTKYVVTLRHVKEDVSSSPQHLLATTGEGRQGPPFPRRGAILHGVCIGPHKCLSTSQAVVLIWG